MALRMISIALLCCGLACVEVKPQPLSTEHSKLRLRVTDWDGAPATQDRLPRRPRLYVSHPRGLALAQDALLLLQGSGDAALDAALQRAPLRAEYRDRRVSAELETAPGAAAIVPTAALLPGARYTLAIAGWARSASGGTLGAAAPAHFALWTAVDAEAGASVVESWPADGAVQVGTNLESVVIGLDGRVEHADDGVWLEDADGWAVPAELSSGPCADIAPEHVAPYCVRIALHDRLAPGTEHTIAVGTQALDAHGAPVGPWRASFQTASGSDLTPPQAVPHSCAVDEQALPVGCALIDDTSVTLRVQTDEAATAVLLSEEAQASALGPGAELTLRLDGLEPDRELHALLRLRDSSGNQAEHALVLRTLPALPTLSIVEVRADPRGPEPQQELVELLNYGTRSADLLGFSLDDRADARSMPIARSVEVAPQTRVLLVADDFDASDTRDVVPAPGALLVRVGRALAGTGLSNAGARLFLRDVQGHRVSAAPATPSSRPGVCLVRTSTDMRDGSPGAFAYDANGTCTPGR
jgi:hypothetical protein